MYSADVTKLKNGAEKKIEYMNRSPMGYLLLSVLAGVYLGFGIVLIFSVGGPFAGSASAPFLKLVMGASFGVALSLVIVAGAELFTGNNMVFAVGYLDGSVGYRPILKLFAFCFLGNLLGSVFLAWLVAESGSLSLQSKELVLTVAGGKMALSAKTAFLRGILCNWLVCLAVWCSLRSQSESARLIMVFWCLFAFIGSGFEHSIANQSLLSLALFLPHGPEISLAGFIHNQVFVTAGNMVGGGLMVGGVYWFASKDSDPSVSVSRALNEQA
jgi:nitrite transporter